MCKLIKAKIFFFIFSIVLSIGGFALAQEKVSSFDVQAQVQKNSSVLVRENIFYDFGSEYKHGIYRDIYAKDIDVEVKSVIDGNGNKYKYDLLKTGDNIRVKIGDSNQTVTGEHFYSITYLVKGAIKFLPDHDELYWNVTGNNWTVPIEAVVVDVILIKNTLGEKDIQLKCYTGKLNSTGQNCYSAGVSSGPADRVADFRTNSTLQAGEGLTVVVGWPKGVVSPPSTLEKISDFAKKYWPFTLPIIVFIYLFSVWWKNGRDIELDKAIVVQYDLPKELKPLEVSYILNQKVEPVDFSATIVDLAVKGYLKIKETEKKQFIGQSKDWVFIKQKDFENDNTLEEFERRLLRGIFGFGAEVAVSDLKKDFYKDIDDVKDKLSENMVLEDYFVSNPSDIKNNYITIGILSIFIMFFVGNFFGFFKWIIGLVGGSFSSLSATLSFIMCGVLFLIFAPFMPKKTKKGTEAMWYILGFKEYITKAEKYRAQFQEKENIFEKFLPYAIIFGCTKKWAKAFEGIYKTPPTWYEGAVYGVYFSPIAFSKSLETSMASIGTSLAARPGGGASGSGFSGGSSGGGFGGGGGGSW
ncbi:MAG: DUF2207 domain-containing protein [bacterium]|nr:DUF2207 domain-containing protein [bacterium]